MSQIETAGLKSNKTKHLAKKQRSKCKGCKGWPNPDKALTWLLHNSVVTVRGKEPKATLGQHASPEV